MAASGYMGYVRWRVEHLRNELRRAVDGAASIASSDGEAASAVATMRDTRRRLESWLPFLDTLLACGVLEGIAPVRLDGSDLTTASWIALQRQGWLLTTDPGASPPSLALDADAAALADLLVTGDVEELLDEDVELAWLAVQLSTIGASSELLAAFEAVMHPRSLRWAEICDELAERRFDHVMEERVPHPLVDDVFAGIAAVHPHWESVGGLLPEMEPYSAALLLAHLDLSPATLGAAANAIVARWWESPAEFDDGNVGAIENTPDIVLRRLAEVPAAAAEFLLRATLDPSMVFLAPNDEFLADAVIRVGTSPDVVDATTAGRIVVPLTEWAVSSYNVPVTWGPTIFQTAATMAMPWLLYFEARADEWSWTDSDAGHDALAHLLDDGVALETFVAALTTLPFSIATLELVRDGRLVDANLQDAVRTLTKLILLIEDEEIADGHASRLPYDLAMGLGELLLGFVPMKKIVSIPLGVAIPEAKDLLESWGVLPPGPDGVADLAHSNVAERTVSFMLTMLATVTAGLVANGAIPTDVATGLSLDGLTGDGDAEQIHDRVRAFVHGLGLGYDPTQTLIGVLDQTLSLPYAISLDDG